MENHLKLFLPSSLKEILLRKVAVLFCSNSDGLYFFYPLIFRLPTSHVREWLEATEEKVLKLGLPKSLNKPVIDHIQTIAFEIRKWKELNECVLNVKIELSDVVELRWTSMGAIDYRKTAEQYVLCDCLTVWQRYRIACLNCMENHIPLLWHELSTKAKRAFEVDPRKPSLESCWPYILRGKQSRLVALWRRPGRNLISFNKWAFEESAKGGNQVAAEYFFERLTPEEREASLMRTARRVTDGNLFFYLLSLMSPEQQMETVKARPIQVLLCFLDWPRRHLLPENAGLVWAHLPQSEYSNLLERIHVIFISGNNCSSEFLKEFFKHAPLDFIEKSFLGHKPHCSPPACRVLCELVCYEYLESIEVMFRHSDAATRVKLLVCDEVLRLFYFFVLGERWRGVEACLRAAALSGQDKGTLRDSFSRIIDQRADGRRFRRFFQLLDGTDDEEQKAKRLKLE